MTPETDQPATPADRGGDSTPTRPRPLLLPTLAFMLGIVLSELVGGSILLRNAALVLPVLAFLLLIVCAVRRKARLGASLALLIVLAIAAGYARHQHTVPLAPNHVAHLLTDEPILTRIAGRIVTQPTTTPAEKRNPYMPFDPPPRTHFVLAARELRTTEPPAEVCGLIRVTVDAEQVDARMGDEVIVTGRLYRPRGPRNPGETDWASWNRLQNIYAGLAVDGPVHVQRIETGRSTVNHAIAWLRAYVQSLLFEPFTQTDSDQPTRLLDTMVLGHRSAAGRQLNDVFLRTGTIHFLTVSGFHVGVLAGSVWLLVRRVLRRGARPAALITMAVIVAYALIVEHNAPVLRAATMGILLCLAQLTRRPSCAINSLALSALCVLSYNPLELFRAGFQLSYVQVLALLTVVPSVYRFAVRRRRDYQVPADADTWARLVGRWVWRWSVGLVVVCLCAWAISLPLVLYHFGRFAPWGSLQSIIVSPLVMVTIVLGFLTLIAQILIPPLGAALGAVLRASTALLLRAVGELARLPGTLVEVLPPPPVIVIVTYGALLLVAWAVLWRRTPAPRARAQSPPERVRGRLRRHRAGPAAAALAAAAVACLWFGWLALPVAKNERDYAVHVLSVGSGDAVLITAPGGHAMLYDAGTMYNFDAGETVGRAMRTLGISRLEAITLSHANFDHYSGVATVLGSFATERLVVSPYFVDTAADNPAVGQFLQSLPANAPTRTVMRAGERFTFGEALVEVLWPPDGLEAASWEVNDRSLVLRISACGRRVLLPGDIEREAIRALRARHASGEADLSADVLLAPHHGSVVPNDTAALLRAVSPSVVVNSTGRERPKLAAVVREETGDGARLFSTHTCGAVTVRITQEGHVCVEAPFAN